MESKMKFKGFEWPENPEKITILNRALISEMNMPLMKSISNRVCTRPRIISGEGRFVGENADFFAERLRDEFSSPYPGLLYIPGYDPIMAVLSELTVNKSYGENSVLYDFKFTESDTEGTAITAPYLYYYTVKEGESIYDVAEKFSVDVSTLAILNPDFPDYSELSGKEVRVRW